MASSALTNVFHRTIIKIRPYSINHRQFSRNIIVFNQQVGQNQSSANSGNVPGLSTAVHSLNEPVGPGASKAGVYKVPEYFNFNKLSYFEAEVELSKYRCPQPSAIKK